MNYAIDNYQIGKAIEISAIDAYKKYSGRYGSYSCPECGVEVTLTKRSNSVPYFRHSNKDVMSPDCDKRVDATIAQYLYERIGLPIYLKYDLLQGYEVNIGFPSLGEKVLIQAEELNSSVSIDYYSKNKKKIRINRENFYADEMTFFEIDQLSFTGRNMPVLFDSEKSRILLRKNWSNYIEAIPVGGIIFSKGQNGGKKIHLGGSIMTDEAYYMLCCRKYNDRPGMQLKIIDYITINNKSMPLCEVYICPKEERDFVNLDYFFRNNFGISLLYKESELIPLWPPVFIEDGEISACEKKQIVFRVQSGNDIPVLYKYENDIVNKQYVNGEDKLISIMPEINNKTYLSVDRKYSGKDYSIGVKLIPENENILFFRLLTLQGKELYIENHILNIEKEGEIRFVCNSIYTLQVLRNHVKHQEYEVDNQIDFDVKQGDILLLFQGKHLEDFFFISKEKAGSMSAEEIIGILRRIQGKKLVVRPRFLNQALKTKKYIAIKRWINYRCPEGMIFDEYYQVLNKLLGVSDV